MGRAGADQATLTIRQFNGVAMVQCGVVVAWLFTHGWEGGGLVVIMLCEVP